MNLLKDITQPSVQNEKASSAIDISPEKLFSIFHRRLKDICSRFDDWEVPLSVVGTLENVVQDIWDREEEVFVLRDHYTRAFVYLKMDRSFLDTHHIEIGEIIRVVGLLQAVSCDNKIYARLEVLSLSRKENRQNTHSLTAIEELPVAFHPFPDVEPVRLHIIALEITEERLKVLREGLGGLWHDHAVTVSSFRKDDLKQATQFMSQVKQGVVLVVVDGTLSKVTADSSFVKRIAYLNVHRVFAFDDQEMDVHHSSVIRYFVDCNFRTMQEAAHYLRKQRDLLHKKCEEENVLQEEMASLRSSVEALDGKKFTSSSMIIMLMVGMVLGGISFLGGNILLTFMYR